jgi:hypothetical protein
MSQFVLFLGKYAGFFYLLLLLAGMYAVRKLFRSWKEWREAYFGLEREITMRRLAQWAAALVVVLVLMCGVFAVATFVVPTVPALDLIPTPTVDLLATPAAGSPVEGALAAGMTPIAAAPVAGSQGCVPGQLEVTFPKPGAEINGTVTLVGTVNLPNFGFYKYEVALRGTDVWSTISAGSEVKNNEDLGDLNTSILTPGDYLLRVVVLDNSTQVIGTCIINIRIKGQ